MLFVFRVIFILTNSFENVCHLKLSIVSFVQWSQFVVVAEPRVLLSLLQVQQETAETKQLAEHDEPSMHRLDYFAGQCFAGHQSLFRLSQTRL